MTQDSPPTESTTTDGVTFIDGNRIHILHPNAKEEHHKLERPPALCLRGIEGKLRSPDYFLVEDLTERLCLDCARGVEHRIEHVPPVLESALDQGIRD